MAAVGTGVSIGGRTVRVLHVRKTKEGAWQVLRGLALPFSQAEPAESARIQEARGAVRTAQAKGAALVGASGRDLIVRYTHVPQVPDWRLEMLMNFEIQEVSEQSGGDVSAAYAQLEIDDASSGDNVVLVALAKNSYLKPRLQALAESGLDMLGACPKGVGVYTCYREVGRLRADETVMLVNVGHENTDIAIVRKGTLLFARNVAGGGKLLTDAIQQNLRVDFATAEKLKITKGNLTPKGQVKYRDSMEEKVAHAMAGAAGHFVSAINSSVMFAKAQTKVPECQVSRVVLTGGGSKLKGMPEYLESTLNLPVEVFDPMDAVDLSALPEEAQNALKQDQGGMTACLGLAQMAADDGQFRVAVLPEEDKKKRAFREKTVFSIAAAAVCVVALLAVWVFRKGAAAEAAEEKASLTAKRDRFDANRKEFEKARAQVDLVTSRKNDLRAEVALGPAVQMITDAVNGVLVQGAGGEGFREVFFPKITARMENRSVQNAQGVNQAFKVPVVEFEGRILEIGGPMAQVEAKLKIELRARLNAVGGLEYSDVGSLNTADGTFKFRVAQTAFPEKVAQDRKAAAEVK